MSRRLTPDAAGEEFMEHPGFFERAGPFRLGDLARAVGADIAGDGDAGLVIEDVRPLSDAGPRHVSFIENKKYLPQLDATNAGACLTAPQTSKRVPPQTAALVVAQPYHAFAKALLLFYPASRFPMTARAGAPPVDPSARLEAGVMIEPGAIVGPEATIGSGTRIAAGALIGARCAIGRDVYVGPSATVTHALIGDRVIIHAGVRIGQDGFGFAMSPRGHLKVPQIGRVVIQDDVEIGANTTIDRGALKDTIIGEGSKIDNLVQIGHNVVIGRHCVLVAFAGVSGSTELGDFVVMGGQSGAVGHIKIGAGAQIGGATHPTHDVPAGARMFGTPARPFKQAAREAAVLKRLAARRGDEPKGDDD
jgi:UDP-3-O-[3-hydroxymyristoyl] glucosamine N-acyltransferase